MNHLSEVSGLVRVCDDRHILSQTDSLWKAHHHILSEVDVPDFAE